MNRGDGLLAKSVNRLSRGEGQYRAGGANLVYHQKGGQPRVHRACEVNGVYVCKQRKFSISKVQSDGESVPQNQQNNARSYTWSDVLSATLNGLGATGVTRSGVSGG